MTFANTNGFFMDVTGIAGDLLYGLNDNFYDPCSIRVTVGVGASVPVVVRAIGNGVIVSSGQTLDQQTQGQQQGQGTAQTQQQRIVADDRAALAEFARGYQQAGVVLLAPKIINTATAGNVVKNLGQQVAVEVNSARATAQILSQSDEYAYQLLANKLRANQGNLQQILQKSHVGFDDINAMKNALLSSNNDQLIKVISKISDKVPNITRTLQTQAANIAVRACG